MTRSTTKNKTTTTNTPTSSMPPAPKSNESVERKRIPIVNLKSRFGSKYRIAKAEDHKTEEPMLVIPCKFGHIYPHGHNTLAASVDGHSGIAANMRRLACGKVHQDGDFGELTILFHVDDFAEVAKVMKPRTKRKVSEEQKAAAAKRFAEYRMKKTLENPSAASDK
jgi:hypothetical protein